MEDKKNIFDFISQVFEIFGMMVFVFVLIGIGAGNSIKGYSSLFAMAGEGYSLNTLIQLFLLATAICLVMDLFLTDILIKNMMLLPRIICFFVIVTIIVVAFAIGFKWFPIGEARAWMGFLLSFFGCSLVGIFISVLKERAENSKMADALRKIKNDDSSK